MNIHEYQSKRLLAQAEIPVPKGIFARSVTEATFAYRRLRSPVAVVKAQVHAGGRGKAGGVKLVHSVDETHEVADAMLGSTLITEQSGGCGKVVHGVYVEAGCDIDKEYYLSLAVDRASSNICLLFSQQGGMNIEEVAEKSPDALLRLYLDIDRGFLPHHSWALQESGVPPAEIKELDSVIRKLWSLFLRFDLQLIEINPLCVLKGGGLLALDAKFDFDDNALWRHSEIEDLRDYKEEDPSELEASQYGLSYVGLAGNIGCLVNGAGLAMATMDIIKLHGGEPLNFLDVGGGASAQQVRQAFRLILSESRLAAILVNIFGGIMHCDVIAQGLVSAVQESALKVPVVIRLEGTRVEEGREILRASGLPLTTVTSMEEGAKQVVKLARSSST